MSVDTQTGDTSTDSSTGAARAVGVHRVKVPHAHASAPLAAAIGRIVANNISENVSDVSHRVFEVRRLHHNPHLAAALAYHGEEPQDANLYQAAALGATRHPHAPAAHEAVLPAPPAGARQAVADAQDATGAADVGCTQDDAKFVLRQLLRFRWRSAGTSYGREYVERLIQARLLQIDWGLWAWLATSTPNPHDPPLQLHFRYAAERYTAWVAAVLRAAAGGPAGVGQDVCIDLTWLQAKRLDARQADAAKAQKEEEDGGEKNKKTKHDFRAYEDAQHMKPVQGVYANYGGTVAGGHADRSGAAEFAPAVPLFPLLLLHTHQDVPGVAGNTSTQVLLAREDWYTAMGHGRGLGDTLAPPPDLEVQEHLARFRAGPTPDVIDACGLHEEWGTPPPGGAPKGIVVVEERGELKSFEEEEVMFVARKAPAVARVAAEARANGQQLELVFRAYPALLEETCCSADDGIHAGQSGMVAGWPSQAPRRDRLPNHHHGLATIALCTAQAGHAGLHRLLLLSPPPQNPTSARVTALVRDHARWMRGMPGAATNHKALTSVLVELGVVSTPTFGAAEALCMLERHVAVWKAVPSSVKGTITYLTSSGPLASCAHDAAAEEAEDVSGKAWRVDRVLADDRVSAHAGLVPCSVQRDTPMLWRLSGSNGKVWAMARPAPCNLFSIPTRASAAMAAADTFQAAWARFQDGGVSRQVEPASYLRKATAELVYAAEALWPGTRTTMLSPGRGHQPAWTPHAMGAMAMALKTAPLLRRRFETVSLRVLRVLPASMQVPAVSHRYLLHAVEYLRLRALEAAMGLDLLALRAAGLDTDGYATFRTELRNAHAALRNSPSLPWGGLHGAWQAPVQVAPGMVSGESRTVADGIVAHALADGAAFVEVTADGVPVLLGSHGGDLVVGSDGCLRPRRARTAGFDKI